MRSLKKNNNHEEKEKWRIVEGFLRKR